MNTEFGTEITVEGILLRVDNSQKIKDVETYVVYKDKLYYIKSIRGAGQSQRLKLYKPSTNESFYVDAKNNPDLKYVVSILGNINI